MSRTGEAMREIEDKMFEFFEKNLEYNGLAQLAIKTNNPRALLIEAAKVCVGIREESGKNDGPMVELMQGTIGKANGEAWCMSFVQTCIAYVEKKMKVVSPVTASEHCLTVWNTTPKKSRVIHRPKPGAIIIWKHGNGPAGHTGFVLDYGFFGDHFDAIEGNTESGISESDEIIREGGGVYATRRGKHGAFRMKIVGFLKPF